jgi:PRTRC genetic system ThiF family protein
MTYRIDPAAGFDPPSGGFDAEATIVLVGCGGTGSLLAESLGRLLYGRQARLFLVDPDRVEVANVGRQAFGPADVGAFKAEVLARSLVCRYETEVGYSVLPYDPTLHAAVFREAPRARLRLVVGCVDNAPARRAIAATLTSASGYPGRGPGSVWWLDSGNGYSSGQVLLGNAARPDDLHGAFDRVRGVCRALPSPVLQRPDLLEAPPTPEPPPERLDCADRVVRGEQGPTVNAIAAALVATYVSRLLDGTCDSFASYFDLAEGTVRSLPAQPRLVADLVGLHPNAVAPTAARAGAGERLRPARTDGAS